MPLAPKLGERAADLDLLDEAGKPVRLSSLARRGPLLVLVFRGPEDEAGLAMLRDYRDATLAMRRAGASICAIAHADPSALAFLREERGLGFPLLADRDGAALSRWSMLDATALLLLDPDLTVLQRAPAARAPAEEMVAFLRRAPHRIGWRDRLAHLLYLLAHALRPRRFGVR